MGIVYQNHVRYPHFSIDIQTSCGDICLSSVSTVSTHHMLELNNIKGKSRMMKLQHELHFNEHGISSILSKGVDNNDAFI